MEMRMAEIMAEYDWQLIAIIVLAALIGLMAGILIGGKPKRKEKAVQAVIDHWANPTCNCRRHEKVTICGHDFWRM